MSRRHSKREKNVHSKQPAPNHENADDLNVLGLHRQTSSRTNYEELVGKVGTAFRVSPDSTEEPHQVIAGGLLLLFLAMNAVTGAVQKNQPETSCHHALFVTLIVLVVYSVLNAKDSLTVRPHPALWRALHGVNLWYTLMLGVLVAVRVEHGLALMNLVFTSPVKVLTEKPSEKIGFDHLNCEITWLTVSKQLHSLWFKAHIIGWWAKMVILRDFHICLVYSAAFELMELTLQFLIAEFQECWWDSIILDFSFANIIGMTLGYLTLRLWWKLESSGWLTRRIPKRLTPYSWPEYEWNSGNDPFGVILNSVVWVIMLVGELNTFFLMNMFQIGRDHPFNILRQFVLLFLAIPAVAEWYAYRIHKTKRIGHLFCLLLMSVCLETIVIMKYGHTFLSLKAPPMSIWVPWALSVLLCGGYFCSLHAARDKPEIPKHTSFLKYLAFVPLIGLGCSWAF